MSLDLSKVIHLTQPNPEFTGSKPAAAGGSFADTLKGYLGEVDRLQNDAETRIQAMAAGQPTDPHQIMMAVEKANLALDLLIEIRNKLMETYQELTRTQL